MNHTDKETRDAEILRMLRHVQPTIEAISCGLILSERKLLAFGASPALIEGLRSSYGTA